MSDFDLTGELSLKIELHMLRPITEKVHSGNGPVSLLSGYILPIGHNILLPSIQTSLSSKFWVKKKKRPFFVFVCLFVCLFFYWKHFSFSNARWFYGKNNEIEKDSLNLTENRLSRIEMWCAGAADNNCMYHIMFKRIFIFENYF